jgi:adenine-specific DNA-methyltransferase
MKNRKLSGSFYTPKIVSDFIAEYLSEKIESSKLEILEPSAGDGVFVRSFSECHQLLERIKKIVAVEKNKRELNKVVTDSSKEILKKVHSDFLLFQKKTNKKFDLVVGNPPYIKKNHLKPNQIKICKEIHGRFSLLDHEPKNIWTAFLVRGIEFTNENGILAFILPSEILQVKFAEELRQLLQRSFNRVEYLNFHELIFDAEGQNTVLVVGYKKSQNPGVYFGTINKLEDLATRNFTLNKNDVIHTVSTKEIHHNVQPDDLSFLNNLGSQLKRISFYTNSKPGIVTAANEFFILTKEGRKHYALGRFTRPIIQRGAFVNGKVEFNARDWECLSDEGYPCYLLDLNGKVIARGGKKLQSYLRAGKKLEIDKRYKCRSRTRWYDVPNITPPSEALFFKRSHYYPKLLKNTANAYVTDSAYMVNPMPGYSINLLSAELEGRYYGGGVLELTPSEFKNLPIPYVEVNNDLFDAFSIEFANKVNITSMLEQNDRVILNQTLGLSSDDVARLKRIHLHLLLTRLKKTEL